MWRGLNLLAFGGAMMLLGSGCPAWLGVLVAFSALLNGAIVANALIRLEKIDG